MKARTSVWMGIALTVLWVWGDAQAQLWTQDKYRWRNDNGSETAADWKAAENTPITGVQRVQNLRLRFSLLRNATTFASMQVYPQVLQYATSVSGPWTTVPEPLASGELPAGAMVAMGPTTWFSNYVSTTAQLGSGGAYAGGKCVENQAAPVTTLVGGNNLFYFNHEYSIQISPLAPRNTTYYFRLGGMNQYNVYAPLTVEDAAYTYPPTIVSSLAPQTIGGGLAWSYTIMARGLSPLTYAASGLPQGLTRTGNVLSGTPTQYGSFPITLTVTDANGPTVAVLTLNVNSPATEVIVDNSDTAHTTKAGTWLASANTTGAWNGGCYYGDPGVETDALSFRWAPEIPLTGTYNVYARWTDGAYRGRNVPYTIHHAGVTEPEIFVNQSALAGQWNLLGTYTFNLGTDGWVELGGHDGQACADAVRLQRVGGAPVDGAPVANAQSVITAEDTAKVITLTGSDPEGATLTYVVVSNPAHGTLAGTGASRTYTPAANYNGNDSFTFKVNDGALDSTPATVSITVTAVNDLPAVTASGTPNSGTAPLTVNFAATGSDVDGDALSYAWNFGDGTAASIVQNPGHAYTAAGTYTATVTVNDGHGGTASASVSITATTSSGDPVGYTWCASENQSYTFMQTVDVAYGANGQFYYKYGVTGTIAFNNGTFGDPISGVYKAGYYKVVAGNQPPTVTAGGSSTSGTVPLTVNFTATGADADGDTLSYAWNFGDGTAASTAQNPSHSYASAGTYMATVTVSDGHGGTASANVAITVTAAGSGGTGLKGEYFDNPDFTSLKVTRVDPTVDFDWGGGAPDASVGQDSFSSRWTGQVQAQVSETYTFYTFSDDGVRLWVNGVQVINNWTDHGPTENSGTITLVAGQKYDVKMEFYENGGGAVAKLLWSSASTAKQTVPVSQLYPAGGGNHAPTVTANGSPTSGPAPLAVTFAATGADADGDALSYAWTFGDSGTASTQNPTHTYTVAGSYTATVTVNDPSGASGQAAVTITVTAAGSGGTGLKGEYFDNPDFTSLKVTRVDPTVDFDWGGGSPDASVGQDSFSSRWTGQVQAQVSETYTFYTFSDDGVRLWVNGLQVINNWTDHGPTENSGTITLVAGQKYDIKMEFYENGGGAVAKLLWSSASTAKQIVPVSQLYAVSGGLPSPWATADIGSVGVAGAATESGGTFTIKGGGSDIWNTEDAFRFVYQMAGGDCELKARVTAVENTDAWGKAGVMVRETLNANSTFAMMMMTPANGASFQYRTGTGANCGYDQSSGKTAPYWVRVVRSGNSFTGYMSPDGQTWTQVGASQTITMGSSVYIGLAVTAHNNGVVNTSTVDSVTAVP